MRSSKKAGRVVRLQKGGRGVRQGELGRRRSGGRRGKMPHIALSAVTKLERNFVTTMVMDEVSAQGGWVEDVYLFFQHRDHHSLCDKSMGSWLDLWARVVRQDRMLT